MVFIMSSIEHSPQAKLADNPGLSQLQILARELKLTATPETISRLKEKYQAEVRAANDTLKPTIGHCATALARGDGIWRSELVFNKSGQYRGPKPVSPTLERGLIDSVSGQFQGVDLLFTPTNDDTNEDLYYPRLNYTLISTHSIAPGQIESVRQIVDVFDTQIMFDKDRDYEMQQEALDFLHSPESRPLPPHTRASLLTLLTQETKYLSRALRDIGYSAQISKMEDDPTHLKLIDKLLTCIRAGFPSDHIYNFSTQIAYTTKEPSLDSPATVLSPHLGTVKPVAFRNMRVKDVCMGSAAFFANNELVGSSNHLMPYLMTVADHIPEEYVFIPCAGISSVQAETTDGFNEQERSEQFKSF